MNVDEIVDGLPVELQLVVLHFVVCAPKVHFLKPFKHYNGGLRKEPHGFARRRGRNGELGVEEVSPRSGANKLAKLFMEMSAAAKNIPLDHLTSIALNPPMFPINQVQPGVPQIKVDMVNDLFCVSSNGQGPHFPGERFTAGITLYHQILKDMHRICIGLPNFDLPAQNYHCEDCGRDYRVKPEAFADDRIELCLRCIGLWFGRLANLEQVFIMIPGLPRAQTTDKHHIVRYGEARKAVQVMKEALQNDATCEFVQGQFFEVDTVFETGTVATCHTIEGFGNSGPCSFDGDEITMYEVAASDVPAYAKYFMDTVVFSYTDTRVFWTNLTMGTSPPTLPQHPRICDGMVEFKFLSFSMDS